jgi:hypothetical protein
VYKLHHNNQLYQCEKYNHTLALAQTNGIPQGSVLMDFIAEMVLGYIDECLSRCLDEKMDYRIIRYRDDYRIFTNSSHLTFVRICLHFIHIKQLNKFE